MEKRKVEVFSSGCQVCEPTVELVKKVACSSCEVVVYYLNKGCSTNECKDKAAEYGVRKLPAIAVDGVLLECCQSGSITEKSLREAGIGKS